MLNMPFFETTAMNTRIVEDAYFALTRNVVKRLKEGPVKVPAGYPREISDALAHARTRTRAQRLAPLRGTVTLTGFAATLCACSCHPRAHFR